MEKLLPSQEDMNKERNFLIDLVTFIFHGSKVNQTSSYYSPFSYSYPWPQPLKVLKLSQILLLNEIKVFTEPGK